MEGFLPIEMVQNSNAAGTQTTFWLWIQGPRFLSKLPTKAAFLQFSASERECGMLYPNSYHRQRLCKATPSLCVPLGCRACPFRGTLVLCPFPISGQDMVCCLHSRPLINSSYDAGKGRWDQRLGVSHQHFGAQQVETLRCQVAFFH